MKVEAPTLQVAFSSGAVRQQLSLILATRLVSGEDSSTTTDFAARK
jgi:hypothetical protein